MALCRREDGYGERVESKRGLSKHGKKDREKEGVK
jgi:hypothetical protein